MDTECGPLFLFAADIYEAAVLGDYAVHCGQPQPGSLLRILRGVEGLEDVRACLPVHTATVVAHRENDIAAWGTAWIFGAVLFAETSRGGLNADLPLMVTDCVPGVDGQVGEHLVHLARIYVNRGKVLTWFPVQFDRFANEPFKHFQCGRDCLVEVDYPGGDGLLPGEGKELLREVG